MSDWKPGDVANGHVLGEDNQWRPVTAAPPVPVGYRERYRRRWKWTALVAGILTLAGSISNLSEPAGRLILPGVLDMFFALCLGGALFGSVINLLVAAIPSSRPGGRVEPREGSAP